MSGEDARFIREALELAGRGWGRAHPNPLVGCVVVRGGEVVGRGWHAEWGGDHAEIMALADAGDRARGSTVYVTLEPCDHHGKTPPCSAALIASGVRRVVYGSPDPGEASGGGAETLRTAGVEVSGPVLRSDQARALDPFFFRAASDRMWVALKLAVSLDGRISRMPGLSTRISGADSDAEVQRLRAGFDALMVGANTAVVDNPRLTVRGEVTPRIPPVRVVLDASGRVRPDARVVTEGDARTLVLTSDSSPPDWREALRSAGAELAVVPPGPDGGLLTAEVLRTLQAEGLQSVLCEGGGRLAASLLAEGFVDRLYLVVAPIMLGSEGVPAFPGLRGDAGWPARWRHVEEPRRRGGDLWLVCEPEET